MAKLPDTAQDPDPDRTSRVVIIGAGLSGLTAAATLASDTSGRPIEVVVVDKGRSVGGRLATRRIGEAVLDHGAQFFTVRSEYFAHAVERWRSVGVVEEWCHGFADNDGYPRYRVRGGMNALAKHLAGQELGPNVSVVTRQRANAIIPGADRWAVTYEAANREPDEADMIIATPPLPQTLELLQSGATVPTPEIARRLETMRYHKVIAILATLDRSPGLADPGALQRPDHPIFTFVADNQAKGVSPEPAVTFHMSHELSERLWGRPDDEVLAEVHEEIRAVISGAAVTDIQVKRWRYAGPVKPAAEPFLELSTGPKPLLLAGDSFGGSKVEGAFLSGLMAGRRALSLLNA